MNKCAKIAAGVLALTLLAGCGGQTAGSSDAVYRMVGVTRNAPLATVNGKDIPAERLLYCLATTIQSAEYYGPIGEDEWAELGEDLKSDALNFAARSRIVELKAEEQGITLTQEQKDKMTATMASDVEMLGGEEEFQAVLEECCLSQKGYTDLCRTSYLYEGLRDNLEDDVLDQYIEDNGLYGAKHILIATRRPAETDTGYEDFSDEEKAQVLEKVEGLREQLAQAGDSEELFDELMKEYSEDGRDGNGDLYAPEGYNFVYPGEMVPEFEEGATALEIGAISEPIQTDYGYHIILRIPVDREQVKEYKMRELMGQWMEEAEVTTTKAWDELDVKKVRDKLEEIAQAHTAAEAEASEPVDSEPVDPETTVAETTIPETTESVPAETAQP